MHKHLPLIIYLFVVGLISCSRTDEIPVDNEELYAVYSTAIEELYATTSVLLIQLHTIPGPFSEPLTGQDIRYIRKNIGADLEDSTLKDFQSQNRSSDRQTLEENFSLSAMYSLIGEEEIQRIFTTGNGWEELKTLYPGVGLILKVSRVGFNQRHDQALLYLESAGDGRAGSGNYFLLRKSGSQWVVVSKLRAWVA